MGKSHWPPKRWLHLAVAIGLVIGALARIPVARAEPTALQIWYGHKYPNWQRELVAQTVAELFPGLEPADTARAEDELLTCCHVVFHATASHHLERNVAIVRRYQSMILAACHRNGVPASVAIAILGWENSGSPSAVSPAGCVGLGQLSRGAMAISHAMGPGAYCAHQMGAVACAGAGAIAAWVLPWDRAIGQRLQTEAQAFRTDGRAWDLAGRHERMRRSAGVTDERVLPACNIEDSVLFMRMLLDAYGGRTDLAISAYHNGVANTDDLLRDWLRRADGRVPSFDLEDRRRLLEALERHHVSFLTLWTDGRSREMLNGLRTMDGDPTTPANQREALGDEADIYVWKVAGALAGYRAGPRLGALLGRYRGRQDEVETAGFAPGESVVPLGGGITGAPELGAYLRWVERRLQACNRSARPLILMAADHTATHRAGLAIDLQADDPALAAILREDWLYDLIYRRTLPRGRVHICLNPRFSAEFLRRGGQAEPPSR